MKVLHVNCNYIWSTLHQLMIRELDNEAIENCVYVPTCNKSNAAVVVDGNVLVDECYKKNDRFLYYHKQKKIIASIEKKINVNSFNIIHAYTLFTDGNVAMQLSKKYGIPYVVAVRNTDINSFFKYRVLLRRRGLEVLKNASAIFFLSETYKKKTIESYVPKKYKSIIRSISFVIPNGIDDFWHENLYKDRDCEEAKKRFEKRDLSLIYAGLIDKNKNLELTVKAAEELINKGWNVHFTVVGKIADEEIAGRLRLKKFISLNNNMPKESLIKMYREADIFVMPSHHETFGLVYAEAMSQGLPVIYTRGQGFDKQFKEGFVGYSVNDYDYIELANSIILAQHNYRYLVDNCLNLVQKFKWSTIVGRYINIYKTI